MRQDDDNDGVTTGGMNDNDIVNACVTENNDTLNASSMEDEFVSDEVLEAMGIGEQVLEAVVAIVGRRPRVGELSTLLAMWDANGRQQSLLGWLRGRPHSTERHDYLYSGEDAEHLDIREPRVRECVEIARRLVEGRERVAQEERTGAVERGVLLYMVGKVSDAFLGSEYAERCLHLSSKPTKIKEDEAQRAYTEMILTALVQAEVARDMWAVTRGGLFGALLALCGGGRPSCGFDILTCREVRLDAFLFGEEEGRWVAVVREAQDDLFLQKLDEAGVDCCFLGRATKGRVLVDGTDFGDVSDFLGTQLS